MTLLDIRKQSTDPSETNHNVTLICDITPLLKLLYNNNLYTHKAMSTISTKYKLPKYKLYTNYYKSKKLPTYQHEYPVLLRKSAPIFSLPGMSSTLKEYSCTATAHRNTRSFWYDASFRYFKGLWSVWRVNLLPAR